MLGRCCSLDRHRGTTRGRCSLSGGDAPTSSLPPPFPRQLRILAVLFPTPGSLDSCGSRRVNCFKKLREFSSGQVEDSVIHKVDGGHVHRRSNVELKTLKDLVKTHPVILGLDDRHPRRGDGRVTRAVRRHPIQTVAAQQLGRNKIICRCGTNAFKAVKWRGSREGRHCGCPIRAVCRSVAERPPARINVAYNVQPAVHLTSPTVCHCLELLKPHPSGGCECIGRVNIRNPWRDPRPPHLEPAHSPLSPRVGGRSRPSVRCNATLSTQ
mmetsp:Transcript_28175/g.73856  ORF Transcript_28175/g.73856 Transcript_28175/m.73856 type:complete len:268 (-) Transcript_28175:119-922(-)